MLYPCPGNGRIEPWQICGSVSCVSYNIIMQTARPCMSIDMQIGAEVSVRCIIEQETTVNLSIFGPVLDSAFAGAGILRRSHDDAAVMAAIGRRQ